MSAITERILQGGEPIETEPGRLTPLPWPDWHARIRSLQVDGATADSVEYDPYRFEVPAFADRPHAPVRLMLVVVLVGTSIGTVDGEEIALIPDEGVLIDGRAAMYFHAPEPLRAVRLFVDQDRMPEGSLDPMTRPFVPVSASPLLVGAVGLIRGLLQVGHPTLEAHDASAASGPLIALQAGLLAEALHAQHGAPPAEA